MPSVSFAQPETAGEIRFLAHRVLQSGEILGIDQELVAPKKKKSLFPFQLLLYIVF